MSTSPQDPLPCPFCGRNICVDYNPITGYSILCCMIYAKSKDRERLITQWNTRVIR